MTNEPAKIVTAYLLLRKTQAKIRDLGFRQEASDLNRVLDEFWEDMIDEDRAQVSSRLE